MAGEREHGRGREGDIYVSNMRRNNRRIEITRDIDNGPYYYGNVITAWIKFYLGIGGCEVRGDVGRQTLVINSDR